MSCAKIAITIDQGLLRRLDDLVQSHAFPSRSAAIQDAVRDKLERVSKSRLAIECGKLDRAFEQGLAEEGIARELSEWPEY